MAGQVVRACGSVLAALTIAAGGLMAGTGTAVGESWRQVNLDQILNPPCSIEFSGGPCYEASFQGRVEADDYTLLYGGPKEVDLGVEATFTLKVNVAKPETGEPAPDVEVTSFTHSAPKGFEFVGADVAIWKPGWILETTKYLTYPAGTVWTNNLDATVVVDPATGQVTVTPPVGGWTAPENPKYPDDESRTLWVNFRYKATELVLDGTSGIAFARSGFPESDGWMATGSTRVLPGFGGAGSSGS